MSTITLPTTQATPVCDECSTDLEIVGVGHYWVCRYCGTTLRTTA
jgi:tRNA(Ile2) C34 agmatinyltransferase TiaS